MKLNIKRSLAALFSPNQDVDVVKDSSISTDPSRSYNSANYKDYENAYLKSDMPTVLLEKITEVVNKAIPDIILSTIDKEAEKRDIYEYLLPAFSDYINFITDKIKYNNNEALNNVEGKSRGEIEELSAKLNSALQREEDYKNRYLSSERQKRAVSYKVQELGQRIERLDAEKESADNLRMELKNKIRVLSTQKEYTEEEFDKLKLELEQFKQMNENSNLMQGNSFGGEGEYIESLKKNIIKLQIENGEMEDRLAESELRIKEITASFETTLHVKDETVMQAVQREAVLQDRIDSLTSREGSDGEDVETASDPALENAQQKIEGLKERLIEAEEGRRAEEEALSESNAIIAALNIRIADLSEASTGSISAQEYRELQDRLVESQVSESSLEAKLSSAKDKIERLKNKIDKIVAANKGKISVKKIDEFKVKLEESEKESERLRREVSVSRLNVKALSNEVELLKADLNKNKKRSIDIIDDDWMVLMEPETEEEILMRRDKEIEKIQQEEVEKQKTKPSEDPAQMKLW